MINAALVVTVLAGKMNVSSVSDWKNERRMKVYKTNQQTSQFLWLFFLTKINLLIKIEL